MVKKCIVEYDDLGNPVGIIELKEFTDVKSFKDFEELCKNNLKAFDDRMAEKAAKAKKEKEQALAEITKLKKSIVAALKGICYLLGYNNYKEEEIIADFKDILSEGEKTNEEEN